MPQKYHIYVIYASYFMHRYQTTISIYIPNVHSLQPIMWPGTLVYVHFQLLACAPELICLPQGINMSNCTSKVVSIKTPHYCKHLSKINICNIYLPYYCKICARNMFTPQMSYICQNYLIYGGSMPIYMPHMNSLACDQDLCTQTMMMTISTMLDDEKVKAQLNILTWPLGQISQKDKIARIFTQYHTKICH